MGLDTSDDEVSPPELGGMTPVDEDAEDAAPARPITMLRVVGQARELKLSGEKTSHTLGRDLEPAVDLTLDHDGVSRVHAVIYRKGNKITVIDQNSTNGTYRRGERDSDFEVGAGETFQVTRKITLIALDDALVLLRKSLHWAIGLRAHAAVDDALMVAAKNGPTLLVGPEGCDQRRLAEEIHRRSPMRRGPFLPVPLRFASTGADVPAERRGLCLDLSRDEQTDLLKRAARGTLYLDLTKADPDKHKLPAYFVNHLLRGDLHPIRPIIAAPTKEHAAKLLDDETVDLLSRVTLPPLGARGEDVPRLLDALILQAFHADGVSDPPRVADLGPESMAGLAEAKWPGNFDELRSEAVRILRALLTHKRVRQTADALGMSKSTLHDWLRSHGVHVRLNPDDGRVDAEAVTNQNELPAPPGVGSHDDRNDG
jgi:hypothetical protein